MKQTVFLFLFFYTSVIVAAQSNMSQTIFTIDKPEAAGFSNDSLNKLEAIADSAIRAHAFPGCQVLVARNGKVVYYKTFGYLNYDSLEPVTPATIYDLASVTKISATTMAVMRLYEQQKINLNQTLGAYLPWTCGTSKDCLKLEDILLHQAGLVAYIPFYKETINAATGQPLPGFYSAYRKENYTVRIADNMYMRTDWQDTMYSRILQSDLLPHGSYVYSDNDFIFLALLAKELTNQPLDKYVRDSFYVPLNMYSTTFKPRENGVSIAAIAPTEKEKYFRLQLLRGDVHDPGAAMFGGVAGHAGLFSNAYDLAKLYLMLLNGGEWNGKRYFNRKTINLFTTYHSNVSRRGYGFDKPEKNNDTSSNPYASRYASPETFGHTGFTGTCVWADPKENLLFIFLSNRVCPDSDNNLLSTLNVRRNMLDEVYKAIDKTKQ